MEEDKETELEIKAIGKNWTGFKKFLCDIKQRNLNSDNARVRNLITEIMEELKQILLDEKTSTTEQDSEDSKRSTDESTSGGSDDSSSGDGPSVKRKKYKKTPKVKKEKDSDDNTDDENTFKKLLRKIDNRMIPELEAFDEDGNMTLNEYFDIFEEHHRVNYKGRKYYWLNQLKKYLNGRTLECYRSLRQFEDEYSVVKRKMLKWYEDEREARRKRAKNKFETVRMKERETLLMYSNRVVSLFKKAYPRKQINKSSTLMNKFQKTVPKNIRNKVNSQRNHFKLQDKVMTWEKLQKFVGILDLNSSDDEREEEEEEVVKINLSKPDTYNPKLWKTSDRNIKSQVNDRYLDNKIRDYISDASITPCSYCKRFGHSVETCRKRLGTCFICGRKGHISKNCWKRREPNTASLKQQSLSPQKDMDSKGQQRSQSYQVGNEGNKTPLN